MFILRWFSYNIFSTMRQKSVINKGYCKTVSEINRLWRLQNSINTGDVHSLE